MPTDRPCDVCGEGPTKTVTMAVEGEEVEVKPDLCQQHVVEYIFGCGAVLGKMLVEGRAKRSRAEDEGPSPDQILEALERAGLVKRQ